MTVGIWPFNQLSRMVNGVGHTGNILIDQFMNQKAVVVASIDKDNIFFLDKEAALLNQQLLLLKVFDRFFLGWFLLPAKE